MQISIRGKVVPLEVNPSRPVPAGIFLHVEDKCLSILVRMRIYTDLSILVTVSSQPTTINYNTL